MLRVQGENTPEALALAMEDAAGRVAQHPADQLDALFGCLSRAMPNLPGRPNFMQEMLGLEVSEVRSRPSLMAANSALTQRLSHCGFVFDALYGVPAALLCQLVSGYSGLCHLLHNGEQGTP